MTKYAILLAGGMADEPLLELDGKTPIEVAHTPALDDLARNGKTGLVRTLPRDLPASEEVALLSALGYDPHRHFTGEAGLAVADTDCDLGEKELALIYSLATEANGLLMDHAAGQVSPAEAEALLKSLCGSLARPEVRFRAGRGFTGTAVLPALEDGRLECKPPEDIVGLSTDKNLPTGPNSDFVRQIVQLARTTFREHEINRVRADLGENPANLLWLWGPGRPPDLPAFASEHRLQSAMVAGLESARGLGRLAGMTLPAASPGAGTRRTDAAAKAREALALLSSHELVVIHIASPAEASLEGNLHRKISAIEDIDAMVVSPLLKHARESGSLRLLVMPTHLASVERRRRTRSPVPAAMFGPEVEPVRRTAFSEAGARHGEFSVEQGYELLPYFLRR